MLLTAFLVLPVLLTVPLKASAFYANDYKDKNIMPVVVNCLDSRDNPVYDTITYSTHPMKGATYYVFKEPIGLFPFQSTHPARGATVCRS